MKLLELTLKTTAENLALDEALLDVAEESARPLEVLRLWESSDLAVVIGRSSRFESEVDVEYCRREGIPILRRCSGGAAVVIGPGCLMYAIVLSCELRPQLRMIDEAHQFVLSGVKRALARLDLPITFHEPCDLAIGERKISGNSMRCKRRALLYHGTVLYRFPSDVIERCLHSPPRQPEYRRGRGHADFVANLPITVESARRSLIAEWQARDPLPSWPVELTERLVRERYSRDEWNFRL